MVLQPLLAPQTLVRIRERFCPDLLGAVEGLAVASLVTGDSRTVLQHFPNNFFQTCITSPPYWSLRDYGIDGQIGMEDSLEEYLQDLVAIFEEVRRVIRQDGTLWLNIGDSYTSGNRTWRAPDRKNGARAMAKRPPTPAGLKPKDLIGVPWKLAFALQDAGWYLRSDVIWYKPNCQPESVRDRPTRSHEYFFMFSKSEDYVYDTRAVRGPNDRQLRTVWDINAKPYREAHFATFPPELVVNPVRLCSRPGEWILDPFSGSATTGEVAVANGRNYVGVEINPEYVEISKKRLLKSGGKLEY